MATKVYRDPIHGSIVFDKSTEALVLELIDTVEFQRLRRIRQLGALMFTFHGAEHSRFTHSLGVAHLVKRIFSHLASTGQVEEDPRVRLVAIASGLLHDLGHGPFSHLYENALPGTSHEDWTTRILSHPDSQAGSALRRAGLLEDVLAVYRRTFRPRYVVDVISSQLDADRLDYLLRDSYMTGVAYGRFDLDWLVGTLRLAAVPPDDEPGLTIDAAKGYHAAEQFLIGRHLMYQQVYYHKTTRAAEQMIQTFFRRLLDFRRERDALPPGCPTPVGRLVADPERFDVPDYLRLDDMLFMTLFNTWADGDEGPDDPVLQDVSRRLARRDLFKTLRLDPHRSQSLGYSEAIQGLKGSFREAGLDPRYYLLEDDAADLAYQDMVYAAVRGRAPEDVWISRDGRVIGVLSDKAISHLIDAIRNEPRSVRRLCFPAEMRAEVARQLEPYTSIENQ